jgi:hypothetical protein
MRADLADVIQTAKKASDGVLAKTVTPTDANAVASNNRTILAAHAEDLRERIYVARHQKGPRTIEGEFAEVRALP